MNKERAILLNAIAQVKSELGSALNVVLNPKSAEASEKARTKGNAIFLKQKTHDALTHAEIFKCYCESIALAPLKSQELALAYGNRSYLLLHMHKEEECIKDIDRALKLTISNVLKAKLLCRKAECLKRLGSSNTSSILEMVQNLIDKIDSQDKLKLLEMIDAVKALVVNRKKVGMSSEEKGRINDYELPVTNDYSSCVSIKYSKKYGHHLVAAKDYKPGDIIFNEKVYAFCIPNRTNVYCQYCLKPVWSSIPCSYCSWAMFCSENCREKAWDNFHDIECSLISHLKIANPMFWKLFMLHIRVLITGIKETGNIANLREKIDSVAKCTAVKSKKFFKNGELVINSIQNIYSLSSEEDNIRIVAASFNIPFILISITKYSKLKDDFEVKQVEDLLINEDIIFLGSLLIKMISVISLNAFSFSNDAINVDKLDRQQAKNVDYMGRMFITNLSSLFNHSCFPTANCHLTEQNTLLIVALQPIKTNSQIFISYGGFFYDENQSQRHQFLCKYNFTCDCQACVGLWPPIVSLMDQHETLENHDLHKNRKMLTRVFRQFEKRKDNKMFVRKLSAIITQVRKLKQPSLTYCILMDLLRRVLTFMYCPKSPSFDLCN